MGLAPRSWFGGRRANVALLALVPAAVLTGLFANTIGTEWSIPPAAIHGIVAIAVALLSPWKSAIVRRGLSNWTRGAWTSVSLLVLILLALGTGLLHAVGYQGRLGPITVMQAHVGAGLVALVLVVAHYRSHPVRPRRQDVERRAVLRSLGLAGVAAASWAGLERVLDMVGAPGGRRRFTGSLEKGSFDPSALPVTSWLDDQVVHFDADQWRLQADGVAMTLGDLERLPHQEIDAVLDCTSGWYSTQAWSAVRLDHLVEVSGKRSFVVSSATGYTRRFPVRDAEEVWLATRLGGEPLQPGHGFPARLVAPARRGFWWVKWVVAIETSDRPWWVQLPFPAT